jgi:hypothetical protein
MYLVLYKILKMWLCINNFQQRKNVNSGVVLAVITLKWSASGRSEISCTKCRLFVKSHFRKFWKTIECYIWLGLGLRKIFTIFRILVDVKTLNQGFTIKIFSWKWWRLISERMLLADPPTWSISTACSQCERHYIYTYVSVISCTIIMILLYRNTSDLKCLIVSCFNDTLAPSDLPYLHKI